MSQNPFSCVGCVSKTDKSKNMQLNRFQLEFKRNKQYRFSDEEFLQFNHRFEEYAIRNYMSHAAYKESLGIFGIDSLGFLSDRMFAVMDQKGQGKIELKEYLEYFDIMLHGTEDEKMTQSFDLLDEKRNRKIEFEDFKKIVQSFA